MAKVIILNGPPGCGKDTIAKLMHDYCFVSDLLSFKKPMWKIAEAALGDKYFDFVDLYNNRETKEKPAPMLNNMSPRDFFIYISEQFVKPCIGKRHFGTLAAEEISMNYSAVFSDGGFNEEVEALAEYVKGGRSHEIHIVRLHRDGYGFGGDSRDYISLGEKYPNVKHHDIKLVDGLPMVAVGQIVNACRIDV